MADTKQMEAIEEVKKEKLDLSKLEVQLQELDATAFIEEERNCRMSADPTPDIIQSTSFHARLAARALGVPYEEVKSMSLQDFFAVSMRVKNFLLQPLAKELVKANL